MQYHLHYERGITTLTVAYIPPLDRPIYDNTVFSPPPITSKDATPHSTEDPTQDLPTPHFLDRPRPILQTPMHIFTLNSLPPSNHGSVLILHSLTCSLTLHLSDEQVEAVYHSPPACLLPCALVKQFNAIINRLRPVMAVSGKLHKELVGCSKGREDIKKKNRVLYDSL